jgi:hypothetical protein
MHAGLIVALHELNVRFEYSEEFALYLEDVNSSKVVNIAAQ